MVKKAKGHIENYKKQDIFADATQAREGIETYKKLIYFSKGMDATQAREGIETPSLLKPFSDAVRCNSSPRGH